MSVMDSIKASIRDTCINCVITKIVDYREKNIYVVYIANTNDPNATLLDGMYAVDNKSYAVKSVFNPLLNDPKKYFKLLPKRTIYEGVLYVC